MGALHEDPCVQSIREVSNTWWNRVASKCAKLKIFFQITRKFSSCLTLMTDVKPLLNLCRMPFCTMVPGMRGK